MAQENSTELMDNENLYQVMISEKAYYEAEKRGIELLITTETDPDKAVEDYLQGALLTQAAEP